MEILSDEDLRAAIERSLSSVLDRGAAEVPEAAPLLEAIREMLASGGKRLRPAFCYWGYRATGAPHCEEIVAAAASLELLHSFALIHDDVMDSAETRRGRTTINAARGDSFAILAGDLALVLADDSFVNSGFSHEVVVKAFRAYSRMRQEVIAGQLLDITASTRTQTVTNARRMALLKSGRYTVAEPLAIGCLLGGGSADLQRALSSIGDAAGEAFQLRDDILGTFDQTRPTGKASDADIRQGKRHFLFAHALSQLADAERERFLRKWGRADASDRDVDEVRAVLIAAGSRDAAEGLIAELHERSGQVLKTTPMDDVARGQISALIDKAIGTGE